VPRGYVERLRRGGGQENAAAARAHPGLAQCFAL